MTGSNNTEKKLTNKDYTKTTLRAYFLQNGFNYGNYQGLGYANILFPALRKKYGNDDGKIQEVLNDNVEFFFRVRKPMETGSLPQPILKFQRRMENNCRLAHLFQLLLAGQLWEN